MCLVSHPQETANRVNGQKVQAFQVHLDQFRIVHSSLVPFLIVYVCDIAIRQPHLQFTRIASCFCFVCVRMHCIAEAVGKTFTEATEGMVSPAMAEYWCQLEVMEEGTEAKNSSGSQTFSCQGPAK